MQIPLLRWVLAMAFGLGVATWPVMNVSAQTFPDRPLRFIVPFPAGGATDAVARAMQPALEKILGQSVVVENRSGAGSVLGVDAIAKSAPDGLTIGISGGGGLGVHVGQAVNRSYDPAKDLARISKAAETPFILVATPALKANSLGDLIKLAKAGPNSISIGYGGNGTGMHLAAQSFVTAADVKINLVPYRGTAPVVTDVIAGHVQLGIADPPPSMGAISEGKLKAIAVSSKQRFPMFPDIPTFDEQGLKDFEITGWFGIVAPAATPREILIRLNAVVVAALKDPEVARRIRLVGMEPVPMTIEAFSAYVDSQIDRAARMQASADK